MEQRAAENLLEQIGNVQDEEIFIIKGRPVLVRPADNSDIDRVNRGYVVRD